MGLYERPYAASRKFNKKLQIRNTSPRGMISTSELSPSSISSSWAAPSIALADVSANALIASDKESI